MGTKMAPSYANLFADHPPSFPQHRDLSIVLRRRCKTCRFIKEGATSYTFFPTNEQKVIRHRITCSSSNLVYMIQCTKCRIQCTGETKRRLSDRFGEHRRTVEKAITQRDIYQPTAVWVALMRLASTEKGLRSLRKELRDKYNSSRPLAIQPRKTFGAHSCGS